MKFYPIVTPIIVFALVGCDSNSVTCGPGTSLRGGQCLPDFDGDHDGDVFRDSDVPEDADDGDTPQFDGDSPEPDGDIPDGDTPSTSVLPILPGDILRAMHPTVYIYRGTLGCIDLRIYHEDGSFHRIPSATGVTFEVTDDELVDLAEPEDCPNQLGLIGRDSAGSTTVNVTYAYEDERINDSFRIEVLPQAIGFIANSPEWMMLAAGDYDFRRLFHLGDFEVYDEHGNASEPAYLPVLVPRWLELTNLDPTIATIELFDSTDGTYKVTGLSGGTARFSASYDAPYGDVTLSTITYRIMEGGSLMMINRVETRNLDTSPLDLSHSFRVSQCYLARLIGSFRLGEDFYSGPVTSSVTWSTTNDLITLGSEAGGATEFCLEESGSSAVQGCHGGDCTRADILILDDREVTDLEVELRSTDAVEPTGSYGFCAPVRVYVTYADETREEITGLGTLELEATLWITVEGKPDFLMWYRELDGSGEPVLNADGDPCFRFTGGTFPRGLQTVEVTARFAGFVRTIDVDVEFPL